MPVADYFSETRLRSGCLCPFGFPLRPDRRTQKDQAKLVVPLILRRGPCSPLPHPARRWSSPAALLRKAARLPLTQPRAPRRPYRPPVLRALPSALFLPTLQELQELLLQIQRTCPSRRPG